MTNPIQFEYAWCLIRSRYPTDIKRGIFLLEVRHKFFPLLALTDVIVAYSGPPQGWLGVITEGLPVLFGHRELKN